MRPVLIYFTGTHLDENTKFTLDFSGQDFVQETEFLSKNKYYIATLNCKLKLEEYIHETKKIKDLSTKICDIDYAILIIYC